MTIVLALCLFGFGLVPTLAASHFTNAVITGPNIENAMLLLSAGHPGYLDYMSSTLIGQCSSPKSTSHYVVRTTATREHIDGLFV